MESPGSFWDRLWDGLALAELGSLLLDRTGRLVPHSREGLCVKDFRVSLRGDGSWGLSKSAW